MKEYNKWKWFREEHDDAAGGGAGTKVFEDDPIGAEKEEGVIESDKEPDKTPAPTVDANALATAFGDVLAQRFAPPKVEDKPLTDEEAKKLLHVWEPTEEWAKKFDNLETRNEALKELRDGVVKNSDTITQYRLREATTALETKYAPVLEYVSAARERETNERFGKKYEQLADPALKPLLDSVKKELNGQKFDNEDKMFDAIAHSVEAVIKVGNPDFKLSSGSSPEDKTKTKAKGSANSIPVTTPGAGGGSAAKGKTQEKPRGLAIFD